MLQNAYTVSWDFMNHHFVQSQLYWAPNYLLSTFGLNSIEISPYTHLNMVSYIIKLHKMIVELNCPVQTRCKKQHHQNWAEIKLKLTTTKKFVTHNKRLNNILRVFTLNYVRNKVNMVTLYSTGPLGLGKFL